MPKNFQQVTAFPSEDVKIAGVRITMRSLLNHEMKPSRKWCGVRTGEHLV